jgi:S1-C subfamily serine protease
MLRRLYRAGATLARTVPLVLVPTTLAAQAGPESAASLEALSERATRAAVIIDVRTAADTRQGSGFIVDSNGLILTNHHVMRDAQSARVKLTSGDVYDRVSILAQDERRDIAIIHVAGFNLPTLPLGNSDSVRIGAPVVLIGSPQGLANTVSSGIVSGRRQEPEGYELLQITAPASQGSSGGAVLSAQGEVVGIAVSQVLAGQNLNFAVPINYARGLLANLSEQPIATLQALGAAPTDGPARTMASEDRVNRGLSFDVTDLRGFVVESRVALGDDGERLTRVTYRVIETIGGDAPRIERYLESETMRATPPFGTLQTVQRERIRSLVSKADLRPLSSRGETSFLGGDGWRTATHDLRFEGDRVLGIVTDTTGHSTELDRVLPAGILLRELRELAFGTLSAEALVGRSVELATFEPTTGEVTDDRYDVLAVDTIEVLGQRRAVLRTSVASGLTNETVYFTIDTPRVAVRRVGQDGRRVESAIRLEAMDGAGFEPPVGEAGERSARALHSGGGEGPTDSS